jgi:hypothetical protein
MSGAKHRRKGDKIEREIVARHIELGLHCERVPHSGAMRYRDNGADVDIYVYGRDEAPIISEVKARKGGAGFKQLETWLDENRRLVPAQKQCRPVSARALARLGRTAHAGAAMTLVTGGNARALLRDRGDDLYETPECAVEALLRVENLPHHSGSPRVAPAQSCGCCAVMATASVPATLMTTVWSRANPVSNFLMEQQAPPGVEMILTNPPFKLAAKFVQHGLRLCPHVIILARLGFLTSQSRSDILEGGHLVCVYVFRNRLPMMHRANWTGSKASSSIDFAWLVWDRAHKGPTILQRISWA